MAVPDQPPFALLRERPRSSRLWTQSALLAVLVYGGALAAALSLSGRSALRAGQHEEQQLVVTLLDLPPADPEPMAAPGSEAAPVAAALPEPPAARPAKARARVAAALEPAAPEPTKVEPAAPALQVEKQPVAEPVVDAKPALEAKPGGLGGAGGSDGAGSGSGGGPGNSGTGPGTLAGKSGAMPFVDGMTRPVLLSKVDPTYTREALAARVEGLILTKCVISTRGELKQCRIVKGLQYMDAAVLKALSQWRYSPVIYQGKPAAVEYIIPVRLVRP